MPESLKNEKGLAFIIVMWVLVLLIALGTEFAFSMRTEVNTTRNFKEDREAYFLAKGGIQLAMTELLQKARYHSITDEKGFIIGQPEAPPEEGEEANQQTAQEEVPEEAIYETAREDIPLGGGLITYTIEDENGKLNLNRVSREILVKALELNGMEQGSDRDSIADSILDWVDADDNHRLNGAENDYYLSQFPPYHAKNGPLDSLGELLKVKGMTPELLYGDEEYDEAEDKEGLKPGLVRLFTVYNTPYFNPNTAPVEVLRASFPEEKVQDILNAKQEKGYYGFTLSSHFRIKATGSFENSSTRHSIVAVIEKVGTDEKAKMLIRYWKDNDFS
ncbi:MAG: general secretion pathway protein GspK [Candidatus Nitronauta litoralis]|uniref:General secretion pathway protein GspK n=1 Tax=Candidatus Nitronauta litoralis TaxID=2705533 RepID=A0A7T0G125_9BACT|nr:MAG: general secretion pathway protein GspK [Candidatus Nitronauta litoralis]